VIETTESKIINLLSTN